MTSVEAFGFGASWDWADSDAEVVRRLVVYLEDRRALSYPHHAETEIFVVQSILQVREELTRALQQLAPDSGASNAVRAMRDACRNFLDRQDASSRSFGPPWVNDEFFVALGELRGVFAVYLGGLAEHYGIEVDEPLASVLRAAEPRELERP